MHPASTAAMHDIVFAIRVFPPTITERSPLATSVAPPLTGGRDAGDDPSTNMAPSSRRPLVIAGPRGARIVE